MSLVRKLGKIAGCTLLYLCAFGLIGGVASFVFDVLGIGFATLYYVLWFVLGVFCGLLSYDTGGKIASPEPQENWTSLEDAGRTGLLVVLTESVILLLLFFPCYILVADSMSLALTFFATVFAAVIFGHTQLRPKPSKSA